jgi:hypothetical protein
VQKFAESEELNPLSFSKSVDGHVFTMCASVENLGSFEGLTVGDYP